ncbi:PAS domain-containing hybrid sensor histidine kinase/response regulator [Azospirillum sp.]|uniref:PAS domain-containing hybrid sensor histidine kinase/response regulator n=1 Tax=Azospirillum sp. TaxID=34012 RepID=UPI003D737668
MSDERTDRLRRRAEQIIEGVGDAARLPIDAAPIDVKAIVHELYVHQAELEIQNEELRTAQQALEVSRQEYLQLFQSVPLACFTVNAAGIVGEANAAAERQFGLPHRALRGRPLTLLVDRVDHGRLLTALTRLRDGGTWERQEYLFLGARGGIEGLTDAHLVALEDGDKGDVLLCVTDVSERNAWVRELQAAREEAESARAAYQHILHAVADGILGIDGKGVVTYANAAALAVTGFSESELHGSRVADLFAEEGSDGVEAIARSLVDGAVRRAARQRLRRRDGSRFVAEFTVSPIVEQRRITGAVMAMRDVTAQVAAESALRLSEQRHRTLVQSLHEGLVMRSADGAVLVANGMAERLLAGPSAPLLDPRAGTFEDLTDGHRYIAANGYRLQGLPPAAQAYRSGEPVIEQVIGIADAHAPGGPVTWLRVSSHPVCDADGRVEAVVSSVTDITVIKAMERELNVALDAKERFMASASHDLRQPVQALMLFSGLLLKEELNEPARRIAEQLKDSVGSLGTLLDSLLDISKLEAGLIKPDPAPFQLGPLMDRLHGEFAPLAQASGLTLRTVCSGLILETDGGLLERVVRNLLANAIRYTKEGRVLFGVRRRRKALRIEVWDTGIGIAENQIDRIFQDFYQVGNAARDRREGLGMGLSIAKRLTAMLGGSLEVRSTPGKGSCFAIVLPLAQVVGQPPGSCAPANDEPEEAHSTDALVLLVEDDAVIRMALMMMLEGWGYTVVDAGSVGEALEHVAGGLEPELVLADYRLPDNETGLILMDTVRRRLGRDVPGILLTGDTSSDRLREASAAHCALLHKPIQPQALQDTVRASLSRGKANAA